MAGLLNPAVEASVCQKMIGQVADHLAHVEKQLSLNLMDRESYLQAFGKAAALRAALATLQQIYDAHFNV